MSAVSAIAARRAKAQAQAQAQAQSQAISAKGIDAARSPAVDSGEEPPMKKARSNAPKSSRITRSKQKEITRQQVQIQEEIAEVSSDVTSDDEDGGVSIVGVESETQDDAWDGLENSALNDEGSIPSAPKPTFESQNFLLSKNKLRKADIVYTTATSVCIRLKLKSTLAVIGQYDLWVKRGVVSVSGAKLHPSPRLHRVYSPSTHSLPIVKCVTTSGEYAEVELRNVAGGPHELERLSPLFDRIKNSTDLPKDFT
ncbi:hypothetical protein AAP_02747 [Ascosphaera apis ARSEF 7405]|uniref:Uncharacterized protein n=1 Tax=Ascosphaera apis ARSEF 7405 TaxID=392613 RepID=A0A167ZHH8_9EURO|nr:hypothetical protein AAP_02747 [Ascosphaera apis ARSEF 7405]